MMRRAKYTMLITLMCTGLLSGCTLFPLKEETDVSKEIQGEEIQGEEITPETDLTAPEPTSQPAVAYRPEDVIAPVKIPDTEDGVMYCISPVNVRDAAGTDSTVIGELRTGEKVTVYSKAGGWIEISYNGQKAYVYEEYLSDSLN